MKVHLWAGGVTVDEARAVLRVHGKRMQSCGRHGCSEPAVAVFLLRGASGQEGDIVGACVCGSHERKLLDTWEASPGYRGADVVVDLEAACST